MKRMLVLAMLLLAPAPWARARSPQPFSVAGQIVPCPPGTAASILCLRADVVHKVYKLADVRQSGMFRIHEGDRLKVEGELRDDTVTVRKTSSATHRRTEDPELRRETDRIYIELVGVGGGCNLMPGPAQPKELQDGFSLGIFAQTKGQEEVRVSLTKVAILGLDESYEDVTDKLTIQPRDSEEPSDPRSFTMIPGEEREVDFYGLNVTRGRICVTPVKTRIEVSDGRHTLTFTTMAQTGNKY